MKAILVIEMPEDCISCPLDHHGRCYIKPTVGITVIPQKGRPELCPLVPMPERDTGEVENEYNAGARSGWNACLDEIDSCTSATAVGRQQS